MRSINNQFVGISQLDDAYTNTTGLVSVAPRVTSLPCMTSSIPEPHCNAATSQLHGGCEGCVRACVPEPAHGQDAMQRFSATCYVSICKYATCQTPWQGHCCCIFSPDERHDCVGLLSVRHATGLCYQTKDVTGSDCKLGLQGEGPSIFKPSDGNYYMLASHLTFWKPNPPMLYHAAAASLATAKWNKLAVPAMGATADTTHNSQSSSIFSLVLEDGSSMFIYMGDRWNFYGAGSVSLKPPFVW